MVRDGKGERHHHSPGRYFRGFSSRNRSRSRSRRPTSCVNKDESRTLRQLYKVELEGSFKLQCPKIDESMMRQFALVKGERGASRISVDITEKNMGIFPIPSFRRNPPSGLRVG